MSETIKFKPEIGKTFKLRTSRGWRTLEGEGTEVNVSEFKITYIDDHRFDYELVRTISTENPLPGTDGLTISGGGVILRFIDRFITNLV